MKRITVATLITLLALSIPSLYKAEIVAQQVAPAISNPEVSPSTGRAGTDTFMIRADCSDLIGNFCPDWLNDDTDWGKSDMHPRLAVDSNGHVHKVWMREVTPGQWEIYYAEYDGTPTNNVIVPPEQISDSNDASSVYPSIDLDTSGNAHVVWVDFRDGNAEVYYSEVSSTGTDTSDVRISDLLGSDSGRAVGFNVFTGPPVDDVVAKYVEHPDITVDSNDNVHIVWSDKRNAEWEVYYQRQTSAATVLVNDLPISNLDGLDSMCPAIDSGLGCNGPSAIHIAWQDKQASGIWEIYYQQRDASGTATTIWVSTMLVSHVSGEYDTDDPIGVYNSASPDIGVDDKYVHITWMDQRSGWYESGPAPNYVDQWIDHKWDSIHNQYYWEIYKVMLELNGNFFGGQGGYVKRESDMALRWGRGYYTGPPDGYSMYPRIAVEPGDPISNQGLCTYITWHDNRVAADPRLGGNWQIYSTELQSFCENPSENKIVQTSEFWAVWPPTMPGFQNAEIIVLTTSSTGSTVTISFDPGLGIPTQYGTALPYAPYILVLDQWANDLISDFAGGVKNNAIHITATGSVTVLFRTPSSGGPSAADTDIYQVLPTTMLGNEYYSLSYTPHYPSWYVAIATKDNTPMTYQATPSSAPTSTTLNQWETLTCASSLDITGCHVYAGSTTPIGFVSGVYATIPHGAYAADTIMEMLLPVERWGCDYSTVPLTKTTTTGDIIRIQASKDNTGVSINSAAPVTIMYAGQYIELNRNDPLQIHSTSIDKPVQVAQYAKSKSQYSGGPPLTGVGDPFEMTIIPTEQFSSRYTLYSPTWGGPASEGAYLTIIAPNTGTTAYWDGNPVTWTADANIGNYAIIGPVTEDEQHNVEANGPIGVYSYGYEDYGAYGYPAGAIRSRDMYPDVALDPTALHGPHFKWQTDRYSSGTITLWRIQETKRITLKDPHAEYIIAELCREEAPKDMITFNLHRLHPYQNITADASITYAFTFGLTLLGNYHFRIRVRNAAGYNSTTDWIAGPTVLPMPMPVRNINTGQDYSKIQAAIDAPETLDGHTIKVDPGTYTENVKVRKSVKIVGAGASVTCIIPPEMDDTLDVSADNTTVQGFKVSMFAGCSGVLLDKVNNCVVSGNIITGKGGGITLKGSSNNTISNNRIDSVPGNGIDVRDSSLRNRVTENILNRDHYGIFVANGSSYNLVSENFVSTSDWAGIRLNWLGAGFAPLTFNNITDNDVRHNHEGILLDYPSSNNLVNNNMAYDNYIGIRVRQSDNTTIVSNTMISNSYRGISVESSNGNTIYDNFLNNTSNAWDNGANAWNTSKQAKPNIIGGPYLGGNYWSDNPNATGADNDGIGDVPYAILGGTNKDYLPQVAEMPIFIASFMTPEGEPYPFDDAIISNGTWNTELRNLTHFVREVPKGNCLLQATLANAPDEGEIIAIRLSICSQAKELQFIDVYPQQMKTLRPFTFSVVAERPSASSSCSDLTCNPANKTVAAKVSTETDNEWWGRFVLLRNQTVKTLTVHSANASYQLTKFCNYTEQIVGDYNIIAVRIPPEMDGLTLSYTVFGDLTGDGKVNIQDVTLAAIAYGSYPGHARWNPLCDMNCDCKITIVDIVAIAANYGKTN